jgi:hypothetical protein
MLTYNPLILLEFHEHGLREAPRVADAFKQVFPKVGACLTSAVEAVPLPPNLPA